MKCFALATLLSAASAMTVEETAAKTAIAADTFVNGDCLLQAGTRLVTDKDGHDSCQKCPAHTKGVLDATATSPKQMFTCVACPAGSYTFTVGSIKCFTNDCPAGTKRTAGGCANCPAGTYQDVAGQTSCMDCAPNTYAPSEGSTVCAASAKCAAGSYQTAAGCSPCAVNTYTEKGGMPKCTPCPADMVAFGTGNAACSTKPTCGPGSVIGDSGCEQCPVDTMQSGNHCVACSAGSISVKGSTKCTEKTAKVSCSAGSFSKAGVCAPCPANFYTAQAGTYTHCTPCAKRSYAPAGSTSCTAANCATGRYQNGSECLECATGRYQDETDSNTCKTCEAGKYTWAKASTSCDSFACTPGTKHTESGNCAACGPNTYQHLPNQVQCNACPYGKYQLNNGQNACKANTCKAGTKVDFGGCTACPAQTYSRDGARECIPCEAGTFAWSPKSSSCAKSVCKPGQKETAAGCTDCSIGDYQPKAGQTSCKPCGTGLTSFAGAVACHRNNAATQAPRDWTAAAPHKCRHVSCEIGDKDGQAFVKVTHDKWYGTYSESDTTHKCAMDISSNTCLCICMTNGSITSHVNGVVAATQAPPPTPSIGTQQLRNAELKAALSN
jgi:hypothetical protein